MEREVFENPSIASLMNRNFINIKVDREEHPELDEIYMVARQLLTQEGGWPNNVFLTPDLKPFYAGGTYAPDDAYGKPAFPRLLEWLHYSWTTQEEAVRKQAEDVHKAMYPFLQFSPKAKNTAMENSATAPAQLYTMLVQYHDARSGGFFQAPKFPHECYLDFLLRFYVFTGEPKALDIAVHSLEKMAAGGIYDHVGCGFHRYAIDKEWYVPHFEKMLTTQALLARIYTDAANLSGSDYLADIAKSILDFVSGPFTDGNGAFYAAIDAETDAVEGAYYAWSSEEIQTILSPEEARFFVNVYGLADIPAFPGHKHANGDVIMARKPLNHAANAYDMPYVELAAMVAQIMNKLLMARNLRSSPKLDDKIIVGWNGLMIDAYAHAGSIFDIEHYVRVAERAAQFILEHALDNEGKLHRIIAGGRASLDATLEDYAYLIRGLISLYQATHNAKQLDAALSLMERAEEYFSDKDVPGYFSTQENDLLLLRLKGGEDSTLPNANAVMADNLLRLYRITNDVSYRDKAQAIIEYFLDGHSITVELASMTALAAELQAIKQGVPSLSDAAMNIGSTVDGVKVSAALKSADSMSESDYNATVRLDIQEGWHVQANRVSHPDLIATQVDFHGEGIEILDVIYPKADRYQGIIEIMARLRLAKIGDKRQPIKIAVRFQPCQGTGCHTVQDVIITL